MTKDDFYLLVRSARAIEASDIHIREGERPCFRIRGDLKPVKTEVYERENVIEVMKLLAPRLVDDLQAVKELDGSHEVPKVCRLRFNFLNYKGRYGIIIRIVNMHVPTIEELGFSSVIKKICSVHSGLVLVTGATGSGKSTTLAAMIDYINSNRPVHILTLEDPIEYIHSSKKARVTQREIGVDTDDFESALRSALRQDPDIILIGEMRDTLTISTALKAAETGHLVFGTVHTTNALNTVGRLISMFPPGEQEAVRLRVADNLYATVSQRLVKTVDDKGMVAAQEIMVTSPGIKETILRPDKIEEIYTYIEKGKNSSGSQSFDQHLLSLYQKGVITLEDARDNASSPEDFQRNLMFSNEA